MTDPTSIFIIDNGAYTIKANYSPYNDPYGLYTAQLEAEAGPSGGRPKKKSSKKAKRGKKSNNLKVKEDDAGENSMQVDEVQPVDPYEPRVFQNCLVKTRDKKVYYGADIEDLQDHGGLVYRRPFEKVSAVLNNLNPVTIIC
jgi:hypothetical protein